MEKLFMEEHVPTGGWKNLIHAVRQKYPNAAMQEVNKRKFVIWSDKTNKHNPELNFKIGEGKSNYFAWKSAKENVEKENKISQS